MRRRYRSEVRGQRSEVRGQKSEVRSQNQRSQSYRSMKLIDEPLRLELLQMREGVRKAQEPRPHDWELRQNQFEDWARKTGRRD
jgi:hypothetical protein